MRASEHCLRPGYCTKCILFAGWQFAEDLRRHGAHLSHRRAVTNHFSMATDVKRMHSGRLSPPEVTRKPLFGESCWVLINSIGKMLSDFKSIDEVPLHPLLHRWSAVQLLAVQQFNLKGPSYVVSPFKTNIINSAVSPKCFKNWFLWYKTY